MKGILILHRYLLLMKIIITESQYTRLIEVGGRKKNTTQDFIDASKKIHVDDNGNPKYDYSVTDYIGIENKVKIICPKHGEFEQKPRKHLQGQGCPQCWLERNKTDPQEFIRQAKEVHGDKYDYSQTDYKDSHSKIKVICPKHGEFEVTPHKHLQGIGCRECYLDRKRRYSDEDLNKEAKKFKTDAEFRKNSPLHYTSARKLNKSVPGFWDSISSHFVPEDESAGEKLVSKILVEKGLIDPKCLESRRCKNREVTIPDLKGIGGSPLRLDFYIPEINTAIEYDGEQHFKPSSKYGLENFKITQVNDKLKDDYCFKKGIKLIRVHYRVPAQNIENLIFQALENNQPLTFIGNYTGN